MKDLAWNSPEWWAWFTSHRRRPSIKTLVRHINKHSGFVVFHGCRTVDVGSYYSQGLKASNLDSLNQVARSIFLSNNLPPVAENELAAAINSISRNDHGKLYVVIDDRELIRYCGHYMIYGSEHLCGIGASLTRIHGFDYRQVLKRRGVPTVVRFRLQLSAAPQDQIDELVNHLREFTWEDSRHRATPPLISFSFILRNSIPPDHVLGHSHPEIIPDPLFHYIPYRYKDEMVE